MCLCGEAVELGDFGGSVQGMAALASWGEWLRHGQGVLPGVSVVCRLQCLSALPQRSAAACQEAGVATAPPLIPFKRSI